MENGSTLNSIQARIAKLRLIGSKRMSSLPAPTRSVRVRIGQILIAAGTRLDPIAQSERPEPAMGQLSIAR